MNIRAPRRSRLALLSSLLAVSAGAQNPSTIAVERARLAEITGDSSMARHDTLPNPIARLPLLRRWASDLRVIPPTIRLTRNSDLPYSLNDGAMWAGRGWNFSVSTGLAYERPFPRATLHVALAPTLLYSQNLPFQILPNTVFGRSDYASPFHGPPGSIDIPQRFGDRHVLSFDPGSSAISLDGRAFSVGATTANEWWGPGIRNALLVSDNAAGIPRYYVTWRKQATRIGDIDLKLMAGTLTQSVFFDSLAPPNRAFSGFIVRLRPAFDSTLSLGFARVIYSPVDSDATAAGRTFAHALDVLTHWENMAGYGAQGTDQIFSLFARWIFPSAGFEVYGEFARMDLPRNLTEVLTAWHHSAAYTLGFQWATQKRAHSYLRLQSEISYLEQSRVFTGDDHQLSDFYAGNSTPQGYTQRGQVIGAAIGPGGSSQFIGVDWITQRWQTGIFVGRIRWDNDALYRKGDATFFSHDVSLLSGIRGAWRSPFTDLSAELTFARRYNYLFQNGFAQPGGYRTVDVENLTLALVATPR